MSESEPSLELDSARRFLFETYGIRGELVRLGSSLETILGQHFYPAPVAALLGEMLAASALLSYTLKFDGALSLQARSDGIVSLMFAECAHHGSLRGYARVNDQAMSDGLEQLLRAGTLAITITPDNGRQYQGIVPLDSSSLAQCIEHYFDQSEQLPTSLLLCCDGTRAAGLLLQALPGEQQGDGSAWAHLCSLAATLNAEELLETPFETLLYRLFHQETVRVFEPRDLAFGCKCSLQRAENAVRSIGAEETRSIIAEQGAVTIHCEFCQAEYQIRAEDADRLFPAAGTQTLH